MYALTAKGMKYMDEFAARAGLPGVVLMENAARVVADAVAERIPDKSAKILVLTGHGNNGGDAVAAARWLAQMGYNGISVYFAGNMEKAGNDKGLEWYLNLRKWGGCVHSGFGIGFDRLLMYITGVANIRDTEPYPRTFGNLKY